MKKKLIATDFDGTFLRGGKISAEDRAAIAAFRAAGGLFGFVTGRGQHFFCTVRELELEVDYHLLYNGAMLALPDGTVKKEYLIPPAVFDALAAFFARLPDACAYDRSAKEGDLHQYYASFASPERALAVAKEVNARFGEEVTAFVNGPHVNIGKKGSGKTQGVTDALAYFGLPADAAAVFGDDYNDIDMLLAHHGWAVETARPEILRLAPHICPSVGAQALAFLED